MSESQGKTLFEHLGLTGKNNKNKKELPKWLIESIKWVIIGLIIGMIIDIMFDFNKMTIIVPLIVMIFLLLKKKRIGEEPKI